MGLTVQSQQGIERRAVLEEDTSDGMEESGSGLTAQVCQGFAGEAAGTEPWREA